MFRFFFFITVFSLLSCPVFAVYDLSTDIPLGNNVINSEKSFLSDAEIRHVEAMAHFSWGYLNILESGEITEKVVSQFLDAIRNDPNAQLPISILTSEWFQKKDYKICVEKLLPIAEKDPGAGALNLTVATALMILDRYREAETLLEKPLEILNSMPEKERLENNYKNIVIYYGNICAKLEDFDKGDAVFSEAFEIPEISNDFEVRRSAAVFYSLCADKGEDGFFSGWTKRYYRKMLDKNLDAVEKLWEEKVKTAVENKRGIPLHEMVAVFEIFRQYDMAERSENILLNTLLTAPDSFETLIFLATVYSSSEESRNALRLWKQIVEKDSSQDRFYYQLGREALLCKDYEEAEKAFEWSLLLKPDYQPALYQLGLAFFESGKLGKAVHKLGKIDKMPEANYLIGICHAREGDNKKAVEYLEKAEGLAIEQERKDFLNTNFYLSLTNYYEKTGEYRKSVNVLKKLVKENPDNAEIANFLGYIFAEHNMELEEAERLIGIALQKEPESSAYIDSMAWVLFRKGEYKKALEYINKALLIEGEVPDAVIADHAGDIHAAIGNRQEALKYWKLALEIYSQDLDYDKVREKIKKME